MDNYIPVAFQSKKTQHAPFTAPDVEGCLAKEALEVYTEKSPSNDAFGMGVLMFGCFHRLNLHAFEDGLARELVDLQETRTTDRGKILRVRKKLLSEHC